MALVVMESTYSDSDDSAFQPATASPGPAARKRRGSVGDMVRRLDQKKLRITSPENKAKVSNQGALLEEIKAMMIACVEEGNDKLWKKVESKISSYEERMDRLEGAIFVRDQRIDQLESQLRACHDSLEKHEELLDEMERRSRAANLVLSSQRFGQRREGEDIVGMAVKAINDNYKGIRVTKDDFTVVHRLSKENTVICAFINKGLRNDLYEGRLNLRYQAEFANRLFVTENLTRAKSQIFNRLLQMKRNGRIWTAFSKGGIPCYKSSKTSAPIRVHTMQQVLALERDLGAARPVTGQSSVAPPPPLPPRGLAVQPARSRPQRGGPPHGRWGRGAGDAGSVPGARLSGVPPNIASSAAAETGPDAVSESPLVDGSVERLCARPPVEPRVSAVAVPLVAGAAGAVQRSPRVGNSVEAESAPAPAAGSGGETDGGPAAGPSAGAAVVVSLAAPGPAGSPGGGPSSGDV